MRPQQRPPHDGQTPVLVFIIAILIVLLLVAEGRQFTGGYNDNQMGSGNVVPRIQQQLR